MAKTANGWPAIAPRSPLLYTWIIPDRKGNVICKVTMRNGSVGFVLAHMLLFWAETIEKINRLKTGGYNYRLMTGSKSIVSAHAGYAEDINWDQHPYNVPVRKVFSDKQIAAIRKRIRWINGLAGAKILVWGGDWPSWSGSSAKTDSMHLEVAPPMANVERAAKRLANTPRGKRILKANPSQKAVINS